MRNNKIRNQKMTLQQIPLKSRGLLVNILKAYTLISWKPGRNGKFLDIYALPKSNSEDIDNLTDQWQ
jgi:hypothetical protein